jgi:ATP-dependent Clp protease protease subunit
MTQLREPSDEPRPTTYEGHAWFTLSGDVNSDMVRRVFDAVADMTEDRITTAHILIQSNGGYVSDGICLYNYLSKLPIKIVTYNAGAVASIAVILYLAGRALRPARFMVHKSHASAPHGARTRCASSSRACRPTTRAPSKSCATMWLTEEHWRVHEYSDLHLTASDALKVGLIRKIRDFEPPGGQRVTNI